VVFRLSRQKKAITSPQSVQLQAKNRIFPQTTLNFGRNTQIIDVIPGTWNSPFVLHLPFHEEFA
jgi:hypothetical protein